MIGFNSRSTSVDGNAAVEESVSEYESRRLKIHSSGFPRPVRYRFHQTDESPVAISNATAPTSFILQGIESLRINDTGWDPEVGRNFTFSVYAPQPVVEVICNSTIERSFESDTEVTYVQDTSLKTATISTLGTLIQKLNNTGEILIYPDNSTIQLFEPVWMAAPELTSQAWIGIFFEHIYLEDWNETIKTEPIKLSEMISSVPSLHRYGFWQVSTCKINASWNNSETIYYEDEGVAYRSPYPMPPWTTSALRPIALDYNDIDELKDPKWLHDLYSEGFQLAAALAVSLTEAISDIPPFPPWLDSREPDLNGGESNVPQFRVTYTWYGFGYGNHSTFIRLAMAALGFYCVVTVLYLAYMLFTGYSSTAWNSSIELVALALQSKRPDHLGNVSVGIDNLGTFNEGVGIRVNTNNELELVFAHDRDIGSRGLRKIQTNKEY